MLKITLRQNEILRVIRQAPPIGTQGILAALDSRYQGIARISVIRDLNALVRNGLVIKSGRGRGVTYREKVINPMLAYFDAEAYFAVPPDKRLMATERFQSSVLKHLTNLFSAFELSELKSLNKSFTARVRKYSPSALRKEYERLTIELSWKSSDMEGNTYTLIDTEILIKERKEAKGHTHEEAIMILNHKRALDYIYTFKDKFKRIDLRKVEDVHRLLLEGLSSDLGLRKRLIGIVGTRYRPLDNQHQLREAGEAAFRAINKLKEPYSKALAVILLLSYLQLFEDGNKRTARLLGNAILLAYGVCPLSYRNVDEADYKKALLLFYEQNSARMFKELFMEQYRFAVSKYYL